MVGVFGDAKERGYIGGGFCPGGYGYLMEKDLAAKADGVTVADARGPFGNPPSDSARPMASAATRDALVVVYAPASTPVATLSRVLDLTAWRIGAAVGGQEEARWVA